MNADGIDRLAMRSSEPAARPARPWFREKWPWLLMLPPFASVLAGSTILFLALRSPADLVVRDYARIEEITDQRFARDARAAALGVAAAVEVGPRGAATTVAVTLDGAAPPWVRVELQHVARSDADVELRLAAAANDPRRFEGQAALARGEYRVQIAPPDDSWRLAGELAGDATAIALRAQRAPER